MGCSEPEPLLKIQPGRSGSGFVTLSLLGNAFHSCLPSLGAALLEFLPLWAEMQLLLGWIFSVVFQSGILSFLPHPNQVWCSQPSAPSYWSGAGGTSQQLREKKDESTWFGCSPQMTRFHFSSSLRAWQLFMTKQRGGKKKIKKWMEVQDLQNRSDWGWGLQTWWEAFNGAALKFGWDGILRCSGSAAGRAGVCLEWFFHPWKGRRAFSMEIRNPGQSEWSDFIHLCSASGWVIPQWRFLFPASKLSW